MVGAPGLHNGLTDPVFTCPRDALQNCFPGTTLASSCVQPLAGPPGPPPNSFHPFGGDLPLPAPLKQHRAASGPEAGMGKWDCVSPELPL